MTECTLTARVRLESGGCITVSGPVAVRFAYTIIGRNHVELAAPDVKSHEMADNKEKTSVLFVCMGNIFLYF